MTMPRSLRGLQTVVGLIVGRLVTAGPAAVGHAFDLVVLCAVGDEEDVRECIVRRGAVADADDRSIHRRERRIDMRAAGAKICIYVGIE